MKREIESAKLRTQMNECMKDYRLPYPTTKAHAKIQLLALQEQYKNINGEYAKDFIIPDDVKSTVNENVALNDDQIILELRPFNDKQLKELHTFLKNIPDIDDVNGELKEPLKRIEEFYKKEYSADI